MKKSNFLTKILAAMLVVAMVVPVVNFGQSGEVQAAAAAGDVLKVLAQSTQETITDSKYDKEYVLRFTSTVDDYTQYWSLGFEVSDGTTTKTAYAKKVYNRIATSTTGADMTYSPKVVDLQSEYFFTAKMGVAETDVDTVYTVRAFWTTEENGAKTYGPSRFVSVADGLGVDTVNVSFESDVEGLDENSTIYVDDNLTPEYSTNATYVGESNGYIHVRIPREGLCSVSDLVFATDDADLGNVVYRYLGTTDADITWYENDMTADEFVLATIGDLKGLDEVVESGASLEGKTFYLAADVRDNEGYPTQSVNEDELTWYNDAGQVVARGNLTKWDPIGQAGDMTVTQDLLPFEGTFDGQGHTISGIFDYYSTPDGAVEGLFEVVGANGVVKNFALKDSYFTGNRGQIGSVAGKCSGVIESVYSDAIVVSPYKYEGHGGIVGNLEYIVGSDAATMGVKNCWFDGSVLIINELFWQNQSADSCSNGGIVGYVGIPAAAHGAGTAVTISNCLFTGDVTTRHQSNYIVSDANTIDSTNGDWKYHNQAAGILGGGASTSADAGKKNTTVTVKDCIVAGDVISGGGSSGLIWGYNPHFTGVIENCYAKTGTDANSTSINSKLHTDLSWNSNGGGVTTITNANVYDGADATYTAASALTTGGAWVEYDSILIPATLIHVVD